MGDHIVVVAGGDPPTTHSLPEDVRIIAADSGVDTAYALGWRPEVAVGDFDSISEEGLRRARADGVRIESHPADKDHTDLELALVEARRLGAADITVLGLGGGRLDHFVANLLALGADHLAPARVTAAVDGAFIAVVRGGEAPSPVRGRPGDLVSLLPVGGAVRGVVTTGLRYPLRAEPLPAGTSRGVSNVIETLPAAVELAEGTLLVITPTPGEPLA